MKTMNLCGVDFEVIVPRDMVAMNEKWLDHYFKKSNDITDVYHKPSARKIAIYNSWRKWWRECYENDVFEDHHWLGVTSHTVRIFVLGACVTINGINYYIQITPSHNYLFKASV